jgi:5-hydroxyisourate hydrolase
MSLSTRVLDTAVGRPAAGVRVTCERLQGTEWRELAERTTDDDGRIGDLITRDDLTVGVHRLSFATAEYAAATGTPTFWPLVTIICEVVDAGEHHHVPLLLSPFGYSTYRGS